MEEGIEYFDEPTEDATECSIDLTGIHGGVSLDLNILHDKKKKPLPPSFKNTSKNEFEYILYSFFEPCKLRVYFFQNIIFIFLNIVFFFNIFIFSLMKFYQ